MRHLIFAFAFLCSAPISAQWLPAGNLQMESYDLPAIWAVDAQLVYAATDNRYVFKTTDGGLNWQRLTVNQATVSFFRDIVFTSPSNGIVVGSQGLGVPVVYHTANGGQSWSFVLQSAAAFGNAFEKADFPTHQIGYVVGSAGSA